MRSKRRDRLSKVERSELMSGIRSKNTSLDLAMKALLRKGHIKFRMYPKLFGKPDFLVANNVVLFCDSSFWHGRNWQKLRKQLRSGSNSAYWTRHIAANRKRDHQVTGYLRRAGYTVLRIWDTDVFQKPERCLARIVHAMAKSSS